MSKLPTKIQSVQNELTKLSELKNFEQTQRVILSVVKLLDDTISEDDLNLFQLFNDSDGKIRANATWFYEDQVIADRKATYKVHADNELNIDFKVYGVNKAKKQVISWATALTPNFEDEPFNSKFNIGIDFIVPRATDRVIIVLTNNYVIRTLELKEDITATYQEILAKWTEIKDFTNKSAVHNALWESFDLQPLNKKFYAGISERFITLRQHLIKEEILDEKHSSMFANRLIGRVIFTWFLDKKGIINSDLKYFDSQSFQSDTEYYKTKLERLFFGVLNTPIEEREYKDEVTPFLNGGLFEARENDLYNQNRLSFPKNYFDDLFEFLSAYNFTTDESTSQFQQVAIDPEMLGRIFENLLAEITEETGEQARKAKGAFYTPREIVDYMCKESLREYLKTRVQEDENRDRRLEQLIDAPDKDFQDQDHNWRRDWKPYKDAILSALDDLKVLDPACGSGAFPIGMLQLLVRVYERLEPRFDGYKAKLQIIERNIYGVDIEPMAVEIARLRTWLSIIVDEESDSRKIKPLPNLEFKFVCANSLIDLDQSGASAFGDVPDLENKLRDIRDAYFNTESLAKKKKLRNDYDLLVNTGEGLWGESGKSKQLKTYRPFDNESSASFFNPDFMFGALRFNILIGNPPYIKERGNKEKFQAVHSSELGKRFRNGKMDFWYYFLHRGIDMTTDNGVIAFITPSYWIQGDGSSKLIEHIKSDLIFKQVIDIGKLKVFDEVAGYHMIAIYQKEKGIDFELTYKKLIDSVNDIGSQTNTDHISVTKLNNKDIYKNNKINFNLGSSSDYSSLNTIGEKYDISQGVVEATDRVPNKKVKNKNQFRGIFVLNKQELETLDFSDEEKKVLRKYVSSKDITPYKIKAPSDYLIYADKDVRDAISKGEYPKIKKHLDLQKEYITSSNGPYGLHRPRKTQYFNNPKIVFKGMFKEPQFAIDRNALYFGMSMLSIIEKDKDYKIEFLLGLLNSHFAKNWFNTHGKKRGVGVDVGVNKLREFPLPDLSQEVNKKIAEEIIKKVKQLENDAEQEKDLEITRAELDNLVNKLFNI